MKYGSNLGNVNFTISDLHSDGYRENNEYDRLTYSLVGQVFTGKKGVLTFIGNWIDLKAFIPSSLDSTTYIEKPESAAFTWKQVEGFEDYNRNLIGLNYLYYLTRRWMLSTSLFIGSRDAFELRPFNTLKEKSHASGIRVYSDFSGEQSSIVSKFNIGLEYFFDAFDWQTLDNDSGNLLSDNKEDRRYINVFTQLNLNLSTRSELILGLNMNRTSYEIEDLYLEDSVDFSGKYSFETQWSPRIAWEFKVNENQSFLATISLGFSPPNLEETLTPEGQVNPDIQPESGFNFELGVRGTYAKKHLFYDVSIYSMP